MKTWPCDCGAENRSKSRECHSCGSPKPGKRSGPPGTPEAPKIPKVCQYDKATLQADGFCPRGEGYVLTLACPFSCPICRRPLAWDGGCEACKGCVTGQREDWTFPGDRYEIEAGHWRLKAKGPRPACTVAENAAGFAAIRELLGRGQASDSSLAEPIAAITPDFALTDTDA